MRNSLPFRFNNPGLDKYFQNAHLSQKIVDNNTSFSYNNQQNMQTSFRQNISCNSSPQQNYYLNKTSPLKRYCNDIPLNKNTTSRFFRPKSQYRLHKTFNDLNDIRIESDRNNSFHQTLPIKPVYITGKQQNITTNIHSNNDAYQNGFSSSIKVINYNKESSSTNDTGYKRIEKRIRSKSPNDQYI